MTEMHCTTEIYKFRHHLQRSELKSRENGILGKHTFWEVSSWIHSNGFLGILESVSQYQILVTGGMFREAQIHRILVRIIRFYPFYPPQKGKIVQNQ